MALVDGNDLLELVHWARRYCDGRKTGAPSQFNEIYSRLAKEYPGLMYREKDDSHVVSTFPFAQDGMFDPSTGQFNAIKSDSFNPFEYENNVANEKG